MPQPYFSIRTTLLVIISLLNILIALPVSYTAVISWNNYQKATRIEEVTNIVEHLYQVKKNLSFERGAAMAILYVGDETYNFLFEEMMVNRKNADRTLKNTLNDIPAADSEKLKKWIEDVLHEKQDLENARRYLTSEIRKDIENRDARFSDDYFKISMGVVSALDRLIEQYSGEVILDNPAITRQMRFTHLIWKAAEYAGQEYALMGKIIASNSYPDAHIRQTLARLRLRIEYALEIAKGAIAYSEWENVPELMEEADLHYQITFEHTKGLFSATPGVQALAPARLPAGSESGQADTAPAENEELIYPVNVALWLEMAHQAVGSLYDLADEVLVINGESVSKLRRNARQAIIFSLFLILSAAGISFYSWRVITRRVIQPVNAMVDALYKETHRAHQEGRKESADEITKLVEVLEVFRENSKQLEIERDRAEAANVAKTEFLANISHEIRTPMNVISGVTNILRSSKASAVKQNEYFNVLKVSSDALLSLINDLLDFSKLDTRNVELENIPFNLENVIQDVVTIMKVKANEKDLGFHIYTENISGKNFMGDPGRIRQILINLCGNAIKFTETGHVRIDVSWTQFSGLDKGRLSLVVEDTGIGIDPQKYDTIFEKFTQADTTVTRKYGGTGLGLAITKKIIDLIGGDIKIEGRPEKGSIFTVTLPLERTDENPVQLYSTSGDILSDYKKGHFYDGKLLIVEDYKPNTMVIGSYLEQLGVDFDVAENGKEAIEKITQTEYRTILMDVQMPQMDGYETTRIIRQYENDHGRKPARIVGLTAYASYRDREKCIEAGMDDYISKPFDPRKIEKLLDR